jgi:hypothetical protein
VSAELAQALGLPGPLAPPPWLHRMVALGLPPAYQRRAARDAEGAEAEAEGFVIVGEGGEEEVVRLPDQEGGTGSAAAPTFPGAPGGARAARLGGQPARALRRGRG